MEVSRLIAIFSDQMDELSVELHQSLCERYEESRISLESNMAQVVIGVRRSGKSTICKKVLAQSNVIFAYANFDDDRLAKLSSEDFDKVLEALYQVYGDFKYLFLDEIQNVEYWQLFVNRLLRQGIHILITGSNSKLLSHELTTHITGRHHKIELYPFSFSEYASKLGVDLNSMSTKASGLRQKALKEYLQHGGMPELSLEVDKRAYIDTLLNTIIRIDISKRFKIKHADVLYKIANHLCDNFCQEFVSSSIAQLCDISDHTAENYYSYLKEAFLLIGLPKFSYKSRERLRGEKVYVVDIAFASERFNTFSTENLGWKLENVVFIELLRRNRPLYKDIFYYKERGFEVDFMVTKAGKIEQLIQVAYDLSSPKTLKRETNALVKGAEKFHCENLVLINIDQTKELTIGSHKIQLVKAADWLGCLW